MDVLEVRSIEEVFFIDVKEENTKDVQIRNLFGSAGEEKYQEYLGYFLSDDVNAKQLDDFFEQSLALENEVKDSIKNSPGFLKGYYEKAIRDSVAVVLGEYPNLSSGVRSHVHIREFAPYKAWNYIQEFKGLFNSDPEISRSNLEKEIEAYRQHIRDYLSGGTEKASQTDEKFQSLSKDIEDLLEKEKEKGRDFYTKKVRWQQLQKLYGECRESEPSRVPGVLGQISSFSANLENILKGLQKQKESVSTAPDNHAESGVDMDMPSAPEVWTPQDKNSVLEHSELWVSPEKSLGENSVKFISGLRRYWTERVIKGGQDSRKVPLTDAQDAFLEEAWADLASRELPNMDALSGFLGAYWSDKFHKRLRRIAENVPIESIDASLVVADERLAELSTDSEFSEIVFGLCRDKSKYQFFVEKVVRYALGNHQAINSEWIDNFLLDQLD
jgi:hypothetical protein